jgi:hypothetical protein
VLIFAIFIVPIMIFVQLISDCISLGGVADCPAGFDCSSFIGRSILSGHAVEPAINPCT